MSIFLKRPRVALNGQKTRRFPLNWYWHRMVRPAYSEVKMLWVICFGLNNIPQCVLIESGDTQTSGWLNIQREYPD